MKSSQNSNLLNISFVGVWLFFGTGTKTLVVHGQNECDIPTQLPVHEDTQFEALLKVLDHLFTCNWLLFKKYIFKTLKYIRLKEKIAMYSFLGHSFEHIEKN